MSKIDKLGLIIAAIVVSPLIVSAAFFTQSFHPNVLSVGLTTPVVALPSATTTGSVASSTIYFEITAVDGTGNQTNPSNQLATTTLSNAGFNLTWSPVAGATGYDVYFSTTTPAVFAQYFNATTSSAYDFTSTSSPVYAFAPSTNNASAVSLTSQGTSFVYGGNGTATTTQAASTTALQVNGNFVAVSPATTTNCYSGTAGAVFYNTSNSHLWGCNGTAWQKIF
jgi:hypothetical protein